MSQINEDELRNLFERVANSDEEAIELLWRIYYPRLKLTVARQIATMPRLAGEASDLASGALHGFMDQILNNPDLDLSDLNSVWSLLKVITKRHIKDVHKGRLAAKRGGQVQIYSLDNPQKYEPLYSYQWPSSTGHSVPLCVRQPIGPEYDLLLKELLERLLSLLPNDRAQEIVMLRLEHRSAAEIAELLKVSTRTVQRHLAEIERLWRFHLSDSSGNGGKG